MFISLKELYDTISWHNLNRDKEIGESVGVFAVLPNDIAKQFPLEGREGRDTSPSHVTVCYIGKFPAKYEKRLCKIVSDFCSQCKPFKVKLGKVKKFKNADGEKIIHSVVLSRKLKMFNAG